MITPSRFLGMLAFAFGILSSVSYAQQAGVTGGTLTGSVSNHATGKFLEGAKVVITELQRTELTDGTGRYRFVGLPAGSYRVVATYTGLDEMTATAVVAASGVASADFELGAGVYKLEAFVVAGDREGNAASITRQRNADSVKHVVSMNAFGNLANDNAGELLLRLPGISGVHDLDGNISTVNIRGTPGNLNMVMVDGDLMASNFGDSRSFALRSISGALFEEIEVTKAPTPDMPADSIGGAVNLKSASPLDRKDRRRISYGASFRWAPEWVENVPMAYDHPLHPTLKFNWQEVMDVFGGQRNLGVTFSTFYSENASGGHTGTNAYESTLSRRAYQYDYQTRDLYNNRKQKSASLRFDYRLSPTTRIKIGALVNQDDQPFNRQITFRGTTNQGVAPLDANGNPTGNNGILPSYTENFTEARAVNNSQVILTQITIGTVDDQAQFNLGAEHKFDRLEIDYNAAYSESRSVLNTGEHGDRAGGGSFTQNMRSVGWTVDRSQSEDYPVWKQTGGLSITNPANYIPGTLTRRNNSKDITIFTARGNAKYTLPTSLPANVKAGVHFRSQEMDRVNGDRQWAPASATAGALASLVNFDRIDTSFEERSGLQIPYIDASDIVADLAANPARWREDLYYGTSRRYIGNDHIKENVAAGYLQGQVVIGKLKALTGVRYERTEVASAGYVPAAVLSTTAQRTADPVGTATRDYNNYRRAEGNYDQFFPGVYLTYTLQKNLLLRANWSNSIGRPGLSDLVPSFSVNESTQTVSVTNAALGPQTSENWDAGIEYYFEPVGSLTLNVFRKNMSDFIVPGNVGFVGNGPDNGFGGDYAGYNLNTSFNGGTATIQGVEIGYQQRFEFLPKPFSGLSAFATYTWLKTEGDYGTISTVPPSTTDVVDFIPEAINAGLSYTYRRVSARVMWNRTGRYLNSYNATAALLRYTTERDMWDSSVSYRLKQGLTVFADVRNLTNSPRAWERAAGITNSYIFFTAVNFGIKGEF